MEAPLTRLYPPPSIERPLAGTYLAHDLRAIGSPGRPYVYANFVTTLDGRTSQIDREMGRQRPPPAIPHVRDWQLYLELAAQADAVVTSSSRLLAMLGEHRAEIQCVEGVEEGETGAWRRERALPPRPTCVVLSKKLEPSIERLLAMPRCEVAVLTGREADPVLAERLCTGGVDTRVGRERWVVASEVERLAQERGWRTLYLIGGPDVLYTMLQAGRVDRLYLSVAHLALGGRDYDTLVRGDTLDPPVRFRLHELYLDRAEGEGPEMAFASYESRGPVVRY